MCLLCKDPFSSWDALTVHYKVMHINKGTFSLEFPSPEYHYLGKPDLLITSVFLWSSHVEMAHSKEKALNLRTNHIRPLMRQSRAAYFVGYTSKKEQRGDRMLLL